MAVVLGFSGGLNFTKCHCRGLFRTLFLFLFVCLFNSFNVGVIDHLQSIEYTVAIDKRENFYRVVT